MLVKCLLSKLPPVIKSRSLTPPLQSLTELEVTFFKQVKVCAPACARVRVCVCVCASVLLPPTLAQCHPLSAFFLCAHQCVDFVCLRFHLMAVFVACLLAFFFFSFFLRDIAAERNTIAGQVFLN